MPYPCLRKNFKYITAVIFFLTNLFVFAQAEILDLGSIKPKDLPPKETVSATGEAVLRPPEDEEGLGLMQSYAREYRRQGLAMQQAGDLETAKSFYEKAMAADPFYAPAYNDAGIIAETEGDPDAAEEYYLRAIQVDPGYLSSYSNLALFYETKRDLRKAATYWEKRVDKGLPDDPWTLKAEQRLSDVYLAMGKKIDNLKERQVTDLARKMSDQKALLREDDHEAAKMSLEKAKTYYKRGDNVTALKHSIDAMQLDPDNDEITDFVDKVQTRALTK